MTDLFAEDEDEVVELVENFDEVDVETKLIEPVICGLDARRRLEHMLDEKRLQDELDDFVDY